MITAIIFSITLLLLLLFAVFFVIQFYNILFRGFAPFVSTHPSIIGKLAFEAGQLDNKVVYELGCGTANFLFSLEKKFPDAKFIGVEYALLPWLIAKIRLLLSGSKIRIIKKNIFKVNLADADLIYCYLNPGMMRDLETKLKKECKLGTQIISYCFPMAGLLPAKTDELEDKTRIHYYTI